MSASTANVVDAVIVLAASGLVSALEIAGRYPPRWWRLFHLPSGWGYIALNAIAAVGAYWLSLGLKISFASPERVWRVSLCAVAGLTVLRGASSGLARPALGLRKLQESLLAELSAVANVMKSDIRWDLASQLNWHEDPEALIECCRKIDQDRDHAADVERQKKLVATLRDDGFGPTQDMWSLVSDCYKAYGETILKSAVEKVQLAKQLDAAKIVKA